MADRNLEIIIKAQDFATKEIKKLKDEVKDLKKESWSTTSSMKSGFSEIKSLALQVAGAIGAIKIWTGIITLTNNLEQNTVAFETMLWSAEKAKILLEDLTTFASQTPFELTGIRQTAKQLLAFGFESQELIPTLKALWDVASGLSVPIEQVAYAYGQVRTANQLYWTELRQFMNAGVPLLAELADMFWVTETAMKSMVENGEIWFTDVQEAFKRMTSEGGKFFNLMEKQADTLGGRWSNLIDVISKTGEAIWTAVLDDMKWVVSSILSFIETNYNAIVDFGADVATNIMSVWKTVYELFASVFDLISSILSIFTQETEDTTAWTIKSWKKAITIISLWIQSVVMVANTGVKLVAGVVKSIAWWVGWFIEGVWLYIKDFWKNTLNLIIWQANWFIKRINTVLHAVGMNGIQEIGLISTELQQMWGISTMVLKWVADWWGDTWKDIWDSNGRIMSNMIDTLSAYEESVSWVNWTSRELNTQFGESASNVKNLANSMWSAGKATKNAKEEMQSYKEEMKQLEEQTKRLSGVSDLAIKISSALYEQMRKVLGLENTQKMLDSVKESAKSALDTINDKIKESTSSIEDYKKEIQSLDEQLQSLKWQRREGKDETRVQLAERALELEKQLKEAERTWADIDYIATRKELALAKEQAGVDAINEAKQWASMSETERILALATEKDNELKEEIRRITEQKQAKEDALQEEERLHSELISKKQTLEAEYFDFFWKEMEKQQMSIQKSIDLLKQLNALKWSSQVTSITWSRAVWGSVVWGNSYIVGERWPEIFTPSSSGTITNNVSPNVTINLWGVSVSNQADENRLIQKIKKELENTARLYRIWIS